MIRPAAALSCLFVLTAWVERQDQVVVPYNHPANPAARSAPPIRVPRIQAPNVEDVTPDPAREQPRSPRESQPSAPRSGAPMQHHQH
jgi:hypothetical protein